MMMMMMNNVTQQPLAYLVPFPR